MALVTTPHIGGSLIIYRYDEGEMREEQRLHGFSNHAIDSREMRLSAIIDADGDGVPDLAILTVQAQTGDAPQLSYRLANGRQLLIDLRKKPVR